MADAETKRSRFERLAEKRVNDILKRLRLLGNLSNRHNYDYEDDHAKQIIRAIDAELRRLKSRFDEESGVATTVFSFSDKVDKQI